MVRFTRFLRLKEVSESEVDRGHHHSIPAGWGTQWSVPYFLQGKIPPIRVHYRVFDIKSVPRDEEGFKNWMYDRYIEKEAMLERFYKTGSLVDNLTESIDTDVKGAFFSVLFYFVMAVCFSVFLYFPVISLVNFKWILLIVLIYMIYFAYSFVKTFFWWINAIDIISIFLFLSVESFRCTGLW